MYFEPYGEDEYTHDEKVKLVQSENYLVQVSRLILHLVVSSAG
jgi:hypothetical protein